MNKSSLLLKDIQRKWITVGILILSFVTVLIVSITYKFKNSEVYKTSLQEVMSNYEVQEILGTPLKTSMLVLGNIYKSGSKGSAELRYSIHGPKNNGKVFIYAKRQADNWSILKLFVVVSEIEKQITIIE